jgi:hypothetical protein
MKKKGKQKGKKKSGTRHQKRSIKGKKKKEIGKDTRRERHTVKRQETSHCVSAVQEHHGK